MKPRQCAPWGFKVISFFAIIIITFTQVLSPAWAFDFSNPEIIDPTNSFSLDSYVIPERQTPVLVPDYDLLVVPAQTQWHTSAQILALNTSNNLHIDGKFDISDSKYPGDLKGLTVDNGSVYFVKGETLFSVFLPPEGNDDLFEEWHVTADNSLLPPVVLGEYVYVIDSAGKHYRIEREQDVREPTFDSSWSGTILSGTAINKPVTDGTSLIYQLVTEDKGPFTQPHVIAINLNDGTEKWLISITKDSWKDNQKNNFSQGFMSPLAVAEEGLVGFVLSQATGDNNPFYDNKFIVCSTQDGSFKTSSFNYSDNNYTGNSQIYSTSTFPSQSGRTFSFINTFGSQYYAKDCTYKHPPQHNYDRCPEWDYTGPYYLQGLFLETPSNGKASTSYRRLVWSDYSITSDEIYLSPFQSMSKDKKTSKYLLLSSQNKIGIFDNIQKPVPLDPIHYYEVKLNDNDIFIDTVNPIVAEDGSVYVGGYTFNTGSSTRALTIFQLNDIHHD